MAREQDGIEWLDPAEAWDLGPGPERRPRRRPDGSRSLWDDPVPADADAVSDPLGTSPRHDPGTLLPLEPEPGAAVATLRRDVVEGTAIEEDAEGRPLPDARSGRGGVEPPATVRLPREVARRFGAAKGALLALAFCALVGAILLAAADDGTKADPYWAAWKPVLDDDKLPVPLQIGQHLGAEYKLADGRQMVDVTSLGSLVVDDNLAGIAIRLPPSAGGSLSQLNPEKTTVYDMCGYGPDCRVIGDPSQARSKLLDREALEIALFTFKYTKADYAIVRYPSREAVPTSEQVEQRIKAGLTRAKAEQTTPVQTAQLLTREALQPALDVPLDRTLLERTPTPVDVEQSADTPNVEAATADTESQWTLIDSPQSGRTFLVLDIQAPRLPPTGTTGP